MKIHDPDKITKDRSLRRPTILIKFALTGMIFVCITACGSANAPVESDPSFPSQTEIQAAVATAEEIVPQADNAEVSANKPVEDPYEEVYSDIPTFPPRPSPEEWQNWPVVPLMTDTALEIYTRGLELGNDPRAFSKIGDCQNIPSMFLSVFDHPGEFSLGEDYAYLEDAIAWFSGSFERESESVRPGFNAASVVSPLWANPEACNSGETPLDCEARLNKPSFGIISLETWWEGDPKAYEKYVREIIEKTIEYGIVPILSTKADNLEGENRINATLAALAYEYDIPLWNFWSAVQPLPSHGLIDDEFHLTYAFNNFDDEQSMKAAWPWRNLTALQALDAVWRGVTEK
jgi:hypothetical protein